MEKLLEDLESNPFYFTLEKKFTEKFKLAQRECWLICIPLSGSLQDQVINEIFVDHHILKPSCFFKSHFVTTDLNNTLSCEIEGNTIKTNSGVIKILKEETAYNNDYKPYRIFIVDQPLTKLCKQEDESYSRICKEKKLLCRSLHECSVFVKSYTEGTDIMESIDQKIHTFNSSYIVLPQYLQDASLKLKDILKCSLNEIFFALGNNTFEEFPREVIAVTLENYIMYNVHEVLFPVIKNFCLEEDEAIEEHLLTLYNDDITPEQLGVQETFCCQPLSAVVELASLNSRCNPGEKLHCFVTTIELLNQDIEQFLSKSQHPVKNSNKDSICLSSADLIPLLIYVIVQARPKYFVSNLYYVQNFWWEKLCFDKLSYGLVTFQAAKELLKNIAIEYNKKSLQKIKKELTLEEFSGVTTESESNNKFPHMSSTDHLLQNVTKMIEASTTELWETLGKESKQDDESTKNVARSTNTHVGDFLSSLRQNSLGVNYGKQN